MTFRVGQKVVCVRIVRRYEDEHLAPGGMPAKGEVYTVSNVYAAHDGEVMLEVFEIYAPGDDGWYPGFHACDFKPAQTTNIDIFTAMLAPSPKRKLIAMVPAGDADVS
jgi:hypothetical protein